MQDVNLLDLLSDAVNPLLILVAAVLLILVPIVWMRAKRWLEAQYQLLPKNLREVLEDAALLAARFVEQMNLSDQLAEGIEDFARYRMDLALERAFSLLKAQGIEIKPEPEQYVRDALQTVIENVILAGLHKKEAAEAEARLTISAIQFEPRDDTPQQKAA